MASLVEGYAYDIFISYRQNDNRSGWVRQFVEDLREELGATLKDPVNIYFDENPHDGLQETHIVDESLRGKLKCLIFIPILSRTYCDSKSFAWNHEFTPFCKMARQDGFGLVTKLANGNVASRVLPIQVHDVEAADKQLFEQTTGTVLRPVDFVFRSPGVNRPLTREDSRTEHQSKTIYRDQLNKTANAIESVLHALARTNQSKPEDATVQSEDIPDKQTTRTGSKLFLELRRRNVFRATVAYVVVGLLIFQMVALVDEWIRLRDSVVWMIVGVIASGFPVAIYLAWRYEISPQGFIRTASPESLLNPYPPARKKPLTSGPMLFVLITAVVLLAVYVWVILGADPKPSTKPIEIAVLPFENRTGDDDDNYVAEGITEDIINRLTATNKFNVRTRTAAYAVPVTAGFGEIVKVLSVEYIVKGMVNRRSGRFAIAAELLDARGERLWSETFTPDASDVRTIQAEVALRIVEELRVKLNEQEIKQINKPVTASGEAYRHYMKGRSYYFRYDPAANDSAILEFRKAIELDPDYVLAWAGLSDAFSQQHGRFFKGYHWTDSGLRAGQRAIELDSTLADGYKAKAVAYGYRKEYAKAIQLLHRAVEISPTFPQAVGNLGTNYYNLRELPDALHWLIIAAGMDPSNWIPYQIIGRTYRLMGDLKNAEQWLKTSLEKPKGGKVYDTYEHLAYTYVAMGRKEDALKLIDRLEIDTGSSYKVLETAGLIAHFAGDRDAAESFFERSIQRNPNYKDDRDTYSPLGLGQIRLEKGNTVDAEVYLSHALYNFNVEIEKGSQSADLPYYIASVHAIRGNSEKALLWLRKAMEKNWTDYTMIEQGPYFKTLRADPDFQRIIAELRQQCSKLRSLTLEER